MYLRHKFTLKREVICLRFQTFLSLLLNRLDFAGNEPLSVGFLYPAGQAHLRAIGEDYIASVVGAFRVVAFVVYEQAEGVGLWSVTHGFGLGFRVVKGWCWCF